MRIEAIAWDFDGVLNRCVENGRFLWAKDFERDTGQSLAGFQQAVFGAGFREVIEGLGLPPESCLFVDDTAENVQAARALGWQSFHFTPETRGALAGVISGAKAGG
ncbi:HAD-IA family hydrolase [Oceanicola sp. D3]|uniref:HAD-IA family hydrolase n=1 Tax=Oceanicola sp. D3 TaxID=2587163 RepID=UPI0020C74D68|nr:HAD-IA family hydrolase [Oceanicola sp. D3]